LFSNTLSLSPLLSEAKFHAYLLQYQGTQYHLYTFLTSCQ
jgi:hypothetical protein